MERVTEFASTLARPTIPVGRVLRASVRWLGFTALSLVTALVVLLIRLALLPASSWTQWRVGASTFRWFSGAFHVLFGIRVSTRGQRPAPGSLLVANHLTAIDSLALGRVAGSLPVVGPKTRSLPMVGWVARAMGIPNRTSGEPATTVTEIVDRIEAGSTVGEWAGETASLSRLFERLMGRKARVVPTTVRIVARAAEGLNETGFLEQLNTLAMRRRTDVEILFSPVLKPKYYASADEMRDAVLERVTTPIPEAGHPDDAFRWLRRPLLRHRAFTSHQGRFRIVVYDQPGRWMRSRALEELTRDLCTVGASAMDETPTYGVFTGDRNAFANRVISVAYDVATGAPAGFTAMVYLPYAPKNGSVQPVVHLGLTMIAKPFRGNRLQTPLFRRCFLLPVVNQMRIDFVITSIAASPAGVGAASDSFLDTWPDYREMNPKQGFHLEVAEQILANHRHEFGCSDNARFDPESFVVHGSNDPDGGGAFQFIKDDPVSSYRVPACNEWVCAKINFNEGDEVFQVGRAHLIRSLWNSRMSQRKTHRSRAA